MSSPEHSRSRKRKRANRNADGASSSRYHGRQEAKRPKFEADSGDHANTAINGIQKEQNPPLPNNDNVTRPIAHSNPDPATRDEQDLIQRKSKKRKSTKHKRQEREETEGKVKEKRAERHEAVKQSSKSPKKLKEPSKDVQKKQTKGHKKETGIGPSKQLIESNWEISEPFGGRFIDVPPIFSPDEQYLFIATEFAIDVYSTSTSLKLHSLPSNSKYTITCFTLSPINSEILYVCNNRGDISSWNWLEGTKLRRWNVAMPILDAKAATMDNTKQDTIFTVNNLERWTINAHRLGQHRRSKKAQVVQILKHDLPFTALEVLDSARIIVAITMNSLLVGRISSSDLPEFEDIRYTWKEIKLSEAPVCFAARIDSTSTSQSGAQISKQDKKRSAEASLDVAIGGTRGGISLYRDLFKALGMADSPTKIADRASAAVATEMHWHRQAVGTLAWSKDGNYLISGGRETVLVLWQLETGKQQFLPNLESSIESVTVSPSGTSYGIRLGDNSVMVLSTSELVPTANVAGIQSPSVASHQTPKAHTLTLDDTLEIQQMSFPWQTPAVVSPHSVTQLLLAVSSRTTRSPQSGSCSTPYLQTFDTFLSRHISRQPLTRTNATSTNLGPEGNEIKEPNLTHVQASSDGKWLATVDEWVPNRHGTKDLDLDEDTEEGTDRRREVHLNFWSWNTEDKTWMLNSRFPAPHPCEDHRTSGRVLDLVADPTSPRFVTVGTDSVVRLWTAKTKSKSGNKSAKTRNGQKGTKNEFTEIWWSLKYSVPLENLTGLAPLRRILPKRAKLAYSNDGSLLVAYEYFDDPQEVMSPGFIHFIDTSHGTIRESRSAFYLGPDGIHCLGFLERNLVCVGREAALLWDVTTSTVRARIDLGAAIDHKEQLALRDTMTAPLLAINVPTSSFAIAIPRKSGDKKPTVNSVLRIFSSTSSDPAEPLLKHTFNRLITVLLSAGGIHSQRDPFIGGNMKRKDEGLMSDSRGYIVLDEAASVRHVTPGSGHSGVQRLLEQQEKNMGSAVGQQEATKEAIDDVSSLPEDQDVGNGDTQILPRFGDYEPADPVVVQPEQLSQLFDYPGHAMPSIKDMWDGIRGLFAPATRVPGVTDDAKGDGVDSMAFALDGQGYHSGSDSYESDSD